MAPVGRPDSHKATEETRASGLGHVQAMAALEGVDDEQLKRALVQDILADQFGPTLLNDAKFQQVVDRVTDAMKRDSGLSQVLSRVVGELRQAAR